MVEENEEGPKVCNRYSTLEEEEQREYTPTQ